MSWRTVVVSSRAKLDYKLGFLVVRGAETTEIHISEIYMLMIESTAVSLTASLLCELNARKIKVIFCNEKRNPAFETVPYYGAYDTSQKVRTQAGWTEEDKLTVWTEIVSEKIRNQAGLLKKLNSEQYKLLEQYIGEIAYGDSTNREGHSAKVYFNALFGKEFTRGDNNCINAALNYGYTILLSMFNREIVSQGYLTQLGIFHNNMFNNFNLSSDLMEPFRVIVDETVFYMKDKMEYLGKDEKLKLIDIINKELFIDGKRNYLNNVIKIYCHSVFEAINNKDISCIKFYYEL